MFRAIMEATRRERRREEISPVMFVLPPEIIREILVRLPARSIGRFRCVSKLFCSLSSDSSFAKSHLTLTNRNSVHRKLVVSSRNLYSLDFNSFDRNRNLHAVELNYPLKDNPNVFREIVKRSEYSRVMFGIKDTDKRNWVEIIGSSNGLVCISPLEGHVFLYNPTTKESKRLPQTVRGRDNEKLQTYGFGFDDYKVVKLFADSNDVLNASVYSLKANSWRRISVLNYEHKEFFNSTVNFNGSIHWVSCLEDKMLIIAFDFKTEEFREMPIPDEAQSDSYFPTFVIGNLCGRLCVVNNCYEERNDIWVMNEYGQPSSWGKIQVNLSFMSVKPLCSGRNSDEVLLDSDGDMVLYNFKTCASRNLTIRGVDLSDGFEADTYVESLISPNSYGI